MENMTANAEEIKAPNIIINKLDEIIGQLEINYHQLVDPIDRLGGPEGPSPEKGSIPTAGLPHIQGESALLTMNDKVDRIKRLTSDYENQVSRLNRLI